MEILPQQPLSDPSFYGGKSLKDIEYFFHNYFENLVHVPCGISAALIVAASFLTALIGLYGNRPRLARGAQFLGWSAVVAFLCVNAWHWMPLSGPRGLRSPDAVEWRDGYLSLLAAMLEGALALLSMVLTLHAPIIFYWLTHRENERRWRFGVFGVALTTLGVLAMELWRYNIRVVYFTLTDLHWGFLK